jgi:hypothetical protein
MSLGMLCAFWNIHNMEGYEWKMCSSITQLFLENMNEAKESRKLSISVLTLYIYIYIYIYIKFYGTLDSGLKVILLIFETPSFNHFHKEFRASQF